MACSCKLSNGQVTSVKQVAKRITQPKTKTTSVKKPVRQVLFRRPI